MNLAIMICTCYNANRQREIGISIIFDKRKALEMAAPRLFYFHFGVVGFMTTG